MVPVAMASSGLHSPDWPVISHEQTRPINLASPYFFLRHDRSPKTLALVYGHCWRVNIHHCCHTARDGFHPGSPVRKCAEHGDHRKFLYRRKGPMSEEHRTLYPTDKADRALYCPAPRRNTSALRSLKSHIPRERRDGFGARVRPSCLTGFARRRKPRLTRST